MATPEPRSRPAHQRELTIARHPAPLRRRRPHLKIAIPCRSRATLKTVGNLRECDCPERAARRAGQGKGEAGKREAMVWDFLDADEVLDDGNDVCRFKAERSGA